MPSPPTAIDAVLDHFFPVLESYGRRLDELEDDVLEELGVPIGPARMKCALLGLKVLKAGLYGVVPSDESL